MAGEDEEEFEISPVPARDVARGRRSICGC